jgi:hypothetical protein
MNTARSAPPASLYVPGPFSMGYLDFFIFLIPLYGHRPQRQRRGDRQRRVARLTAARGAWLGLTRRDRGFREPDGQASALAQAMS